MNILNFVMNYWHDVIVFSILGWGIKRWLPTWNKMTTAEKVAYVRRLLENLFPIALSLVTDAETKYSGSGTGDLKRAWVIDQLYSRVPDQFKPFVTEENLNNILERALLQAKILWEKSGGINKLLGR